MVAPDRPFWPAAMLCILACLGFGKSLYDNRVDYVWREAEEIARKVDQVTPPGGMIFADELTYFVSRRPPPRYGAVGFAQIQPGAGHHGGAAPGFEKKNSSAG